MALVVKPSASAATTRVPIGSVAPGRLVVLAVPLPAHLAAVLAMSATALTCRATMPADVRLWWVVDYG